jgi:hypothetical protein
MEHNLSLQLSAQLSAQLQETLDRELPYLNALTETQASAAPQKPGGWTPKQELGHLLDSALNNHIRFVRAALEGSYNGPSYAQNEWVKLHAWEQLPWKTIVGFWQQHNILLVHVIARISTERLDSQCVIDYRPAGTLRFLIADYVLHMQHHLDHLLSREFVTQYPGA